MAEGARWRPWRRTATPTVKTEPDRATANGAGAADELRARREEIARMEERALLETESLAVQRADVERRAQALDDRERNLAKDA